MWKKLTALSLSLLICLSMLPAQAGAMDAAEDEQPLQAEDQVSPENGDAGIAPYAMVDYPHEGDGGGSYVPPPRPAGPGAGDQNGPGYPFGTIWGLLFP